MRDAAASPSSSSSRRSKRCKKQKYRDYFIEANGCRSKRAYNMARCVNDDAASAALHGACVANKTKMRKIRFVCDSGRAFKKEVEIIKRCGRSRS